MGGKGHEGWVGYVGYMNEVGRVNQYIECSIQNMSNIWGYGYGWDVCRWVGRGIKIFLYSRPQI